MNYRLTFVMLCLILIAACSSRQEVSNRDSESTIDATVAPTPKEVATSTSLPPTAPVQFAIESSSPGQDMAYAFQATSGEVIHYWLYLPEDYDGKRSWPLLIALHGNLGFEPSLERVREQNPTAFVNSEVEFPFIVISPQGQDAPWDTYQEPIEELIGHLGESLNIDSEAQFLTGLSVSGALGALQWVLAFPDRFTGLGLIAGSASSPVFELDPKEACKLINLPIWVGHSEADEHAPIESIRTAVEALEDCGSTKITFMRYSGLNHAEAIATAFGDPDLYDWMLALAE